MKTYRLWVMSDQGWVMACTVLAANREQALADALALLPPELRNKPAELREASQPPPPTPPTAP